MADVVVKLDTTAPFRRVAIDGKKLSFAGDIATTSVTPGDYVLTWVVMGEPGSSYSIEITKPKESKFSYEATFDNTGKDAGLLWFKVGAVLLLSLLLPAFSLLAQTAPASGMRHLADPSLTSPISVPTPTLILEGTTAGKSATARIGVQRGDVLLESKLSGPVDGNGAAHPASLEGLANLATLELGATVMHWRPVPDAAGMQTVCDEYGTAARVHLDTCARSSLPTGDWRRRFDESVDYGTPFFFSIRGVIGRKAFSWADSTTLVHSRVTRTPVSGTVSAGIYRASVGFFSASYEYEIAYGGADPVQVCRPLPTPGTLACGDEKLHGPNRTASSLVRAEYRRIFTSGFGVRAIATRRFASDTWGLELPLYFLRDGKGLTGGLSAGWRSDTGDVTVGFFVGDVLALVP